VIAPAVVIVVVNVAVKALRAMEPGSRAKEDAAREPFWPIIAVRSAVIWRNLVIAVRANRRRPDFDRDLCRSAMAGSREKAGGQNRKSQKLESMHCVPSQVG
jgi:hypothetical protein